MRSSKRVEIRIHNNDDTVETWNVDDVEEINIKDERIVDSKPQRNVMPNPLGITAPKQGD